MPARWPYTVACYAIAGYGWDVLAKPALVARQARQAAGQKPVLNVGAGTPGSSFRAQLLGPTLWGDVNVDLNAPRNIPHGPDRVSWGDAHRLPWPNKTFGAVVASHVLEHVDDPRRALAEFHRVADHVFAIVPAWWCLHTWLHPGHQWFITEGRARPLWRGDRRPQALPQPLTPRRRSLPAPPRPAALLT